MVTTYVGFLHITNRSFTLLLENDLYEVYVKIERKWMDIKIKEPALDVVVYYLYNWIKKTCHVKASIRLKKEERKSLFTK